MKSAYTEIVQVNIYGVTLAQITQKGIDISELLSNAGLKSFVVFEVPNLAEDFNSSSLSTFSTSCSLDYNDNEFDNSIDMDYDNSQDHHISEVVRCSSMVCDRKHYSNLNWSLSTLGDNEYANGTQSESVLGVMNVLLDEVDKLLIVPAMIEVDDTIPAASYKHNIEIKTTTEEPQLSCNSIAIEQGSFMNDFFDDDVMDEANNDYNTAYGTDGKNVSKSIQDTVSMPNNVITVVKNSQKQYRENADQSNQDLTSVPIVSDHPVKTNLQASRRQTKFNGLRLTVGKIKKAVNENTKFIKCYYQNCTAELLHRPGYGRDRLLNHARTHVTGVNSFKCALCNFTGQTEHAIRYHHKKKHIGQKWKFPIKKEEKEEFMKLMEVFKICFPGWDAKIRSDDISNVIPGTLCPKKYIGVDELLKLRKKHTT